jgi:hypothetical protein
VTAPRFEITPKHIVRFFAKEYRMRVSEADARSWLSLWGRTFAHRLKEITTPHLSDLFRQATLRDFPNRAFTRVYRKLDEAITCAMDEYGDRFGLEWKEGVSAEPERCRLVRYLMAAGTAQRREGILCEGITYCVASSDQAGEQRMYRIHVTLQSRKVKARIMDPDESLPRRVRVFGDIALPGPRPSKRQSKPAHLRSSLTIQ